MRFRRKNWPLGLEYKFPSIEEPFPSVTSVIGRVVAAEALEKWKRTRVAEAAYRGSDWRSHDEQTAIEMILTAAKGETRRAALRGTEVHEAIEHLDLERVDEEWKVPYLVAAAQAIGEMGEHFASEITLVNLTHHYAGTADILTRRLDHAFDLEVGDWKTVKIGSTAGWRSHQLQLAALSMCKHYVTEGGDIAHLPADITALRIVGLREDQTYDSRLLIDDERIQRLGLAFLGALELFRLDADYPNLEVWETAKE